MIPLLIVLAVVLVLVLAAAVLRVGVLAVYDRDGPTVRARVGPVTVKLYPRESKKKEKASSPKSGKKEEQEEGGGLEQFRQYLPILREMAGPGAEALRIDPFVLHLTWGLPDPALAAVGFGLANSAMGILWPVLDNTFHIPNPDLGVAMDFQREWPAVYCRAGLTLTVGQCILLGMRLLRSGAALHKNKKEGNSHESEQHTHQ